jgi:C-terminal processing protease CtpA/Prc
MRRSVSVRSAAVAIALAVAFSGAVFAGHGGKCTKSSAECAAHMKEHYQAKGWLGIEADKSEDGLKVLSVVPGSPAERAGIQGGDVLVSVNGISYADKSAMKEMKKTGLGIGQTATYVVKRGGETLDVTATLERMPETLLAEMIEKHTREEHTVAKN